MPSYALRAEFRTMLEAIRQMLVSTLNSSLFTFAKEKYRTIKLRGVSSVRKHQCPVCDRRVGYFEPLPEELRKHGYKYTTDDAETCNAKGYSCPICGATDRDRLSALYVREYFRAVGPDDHMKVVDFAPSRPLSRFIRKLITAPPRRSSFRTADLMAQDVDDRVDITEMKIYDDNSVDFFICSHVLEHVADDKKALRELYRILKPCGRGILLVPIAITAEEIDEDPSIADSAERWRRFGQDDHVRQYSKQEFVSRAEEAGFKVHQYGSAYFGKDTFGTHGITDRSVLYVVEKT